MQLINDKMPYGERFLVVKYFKFANKFGLLKESHSKIFNKTITLPLFKGF